MNLLPAALCLCLLLGGDEERAHRLYAEGRYKEAAQAFRAELRSRPQDPELHYNLALALWRAGERDEAETAAEKAASLSAGKLAGLRDGILGNLRFEQSAAVEPTDLPRALQLAEQARDLYLAGASRERTPGELVRNLERALRRIDELKQKLAGQKREDKQPPDKDERRDEDQKEDKPQSQPQSQSRPQEDPSSRPQSQPQDQPAQEPKPNQDQPEDRRPEPRPQEQSQAGEPKPDQKQQPGAGRQDERKAGHQAPAPGEPGALRELTPEERKRLLDVLQQLEAMREKIHAAQKLRRPQVEKDW
jgi:tetratricopeptide (TPR) repeat protein